MKATDAQCTLAVPWSQPALAPFTPAGGPKLETFSAIPQNTRWTVGGLSWSHLGRTDPGMCLLQGCPRATCRGDNAPQKRIRQQGSTPSTCFWRVWRLWAVCPGPPASHRPTGTRRVSVGPSGVGDVPSPRPMLVTRCAHWVMQRPE